MIKINKKIEYAMIALKYLASQEEGKLTSAREICDRFNTPFDTTAKVLQIMNNRGLLSSTKGIKGGYTLSRPLSQITFTELGTMIEGTENFGRFCESPKGICDLYGVCNIVTPVELLNNKVNSFLSGLTLDELLMAEQV